MIAALLLAAGRPAILVAALTAAVAAPDYDIGPPVGARIPALQAQDATGAPRTLGNLVARKGMVLVFFRSAKWCPFCQAQLIGLKDVDEPLRQRGYRLAAISYDPPATLAEFAQRRGIGYVLLSDPGSRTIDAFHLRDPQYPKDSIAYGVPEPAIFVVAPNGTIRAKLAEKGFKQRPTNEAVLAAVDSLGR